MSVYGYVKGDPINATDPTGMLMHALHSMADIDPCGCENQTFDASNVTLSDNSSTGSRVDSLNTHNDSLGASPSIGGGAAAQNTYHSEPKNVKDLNPTAQALVKAMEDNKMIDGEKVFQTDRTLETGGVATAKGYDGHVLHPDSDDQDSFGLGHGIITLNPGDGLAHTHNVGLDVTPGKGDGLASDVSGRAAYVGTKEFNNNVSIRLFTVETNPNGTHNVTLIYGPTINSAQEDRLRDYMSGWQK